MTKHTPISADDRAAEVGMKSALRMAVEIASNAPGGRQALGEALCATLETVAGGAPQYDAFGDMRSDAAFWADIATPMELEVYGAAALKRIERATFAPAARKRIFNALWQSFTDEERKRFLARAKER